MKHKDIRLKVVLLSVMHGFKNRMLRFFLRVATYPLLYPLLVGTILRLVFAPFTSDPNDIVVWYRVSNDLLAGLNIYTTRSFSYPPLWAYTLFFMVWLSSSFMNPKWFGVHTDTLKNLPVESWKLPPIVTSPLFNVLCKLPLIIADLLMGIIIYDMVKGLRDEKYAKLSFILWFFNPLVIWIDSIHGQFDVLPALMTMLSFCLFYKHNYFASGIAISLGSLFKLYPLFLVPLYLFSIASLEQSDASSRLNYIKKVIIECSRFVGGLLISFLIFLLPLVDSNFFHTVFTRTRVISSIGGLSFFGIAYVPGSEALFHWIISNSVLVSYVLIALCIGASLTVGFLSFFSIRKNFLKTFVLGHVAIIAIIYTTSPVVNPQYILWILPFLILSYSLYRYYLIRLVFLSISSLAFLIGIGGPLFFFYPIAVFTSFLNIKTVYASVCFFNDAIGYVILVISGISGIIILINLLESTITFLLKMQNKPKNSFILQQKCKKVVRQLESKWRIIAPLRALTLTLIVLMTSQFLVYTLPLTQQNIVFSVDNPIFNKKVEIQYSVKSGNYPVDVQILAMPIKTMPVDEEVFIYYDEDYPSSLVDRAGWIGLLDHIPVELELRGYNGSIKIVNAAELRDKMQGNSKSIIIIPSGVFPDTVHTKNESLVGEWLRSGGTLIWIGDAFAYFLGHKGKSVELFSEGNYSYIAQNLTLGFTLFNGTLMENERFAAISRSNFSKALDLRYPDALVGASVSEVLKHEGLVLGKITDSEDVRTSIAYVPVGSGHLILFGGGVGRAFTATGEDVIAHDIAQILCSGFPFSTEIVAYNLHELDRNYEENGSISVTLPDGEDTTGVIVAAFSKSPYVRFFTRRFYPINND